MKVKFFSFVFNQACVGIYVHMSVTWEQFPSVNSETFGPLWQKNQKSKVSYYASRISQFLLMKNCLYLNSYWFYLLDNYTTTISSLNTTYSTLHYLDGAAYLCSGKIHTIIFLNGWISCPRTNPAKIYVKRSLTGLKH